MSRLYLYRSQLAFLAGLVAVGAIVWIGWSSAHTQNVQKERAVDTATTGASQSTEFLNRFIVICSAGDDRARAFQSARASDGRSMCDVAAEIRDSPAIADPRALIGEQGAIGATGASGKDGKNGIDGKDGVNGKDGKDGVNGKDGSNGINGKDGKPGENTKSPPVTTTKTVTPEPSPPPTK